jgi:hypothetical protein
MSDSKGPELAIASGATRRFGCLPSPPDPTLFRIFFVKSILGCLAGASSLFGAVLALGIFTALAENDGKSPVENRNIRLVVFLFDAVALQQLILFLSDAMIGVYVGNVWLNGQEAGLASQVRSCATRVIPRTLQAPSTPRS